MKRRGPELHVAALLDGRPGHEKQTLGIVDALERRASVRVTSLTVQRPSPLQRLLQTCRLLLTEGGLCHPSLATADLLIGTGSITHLPLLLFKRQYRIPAVTCMTPALHLRRLFDLCFVPAHDTRTGDNICVTVGAPNRSVNYGQHQQGKGVILLGGIDPASHSWNSRHIVSMVAEIISSDCKRSWVIASSPRTPPETVLQINALIDQHPNAVFVSYQDTQPGWVEEQYAASSVAWVTADSISMMYEALAAGCRLGILPVRWRRPDGKFKKNEDLILANNLAVSFESWLQHRGEWRTTEYTNQAERCAARIVELWAK